MACNTLPEIGTWKHIHHNKRTIITRLDLSGIIHIMKHVGKCANDTNYFRLPRLRYFFLSGENHFANYFRLLRLGYYILWVGLGLNSFSIECE